MIEVVWSVACRGGGSKEDEGFGGPGFASTSPCNCTTGSGNRHVLRRHRHGTLLRLSVSCSGLCHRTWLQRRGQRRRFLLKLAARLGPNPDLPVHLRLLLGPLWPIWCQIWRHLSQIVPPLLADCSAICRHLPPICPDWGQSCLHFFCFAGLLWVRGLARHPRP